ncbi:type IV secretory system conjugative DNA transfer family protein [Tenacibaculum finnmarkense]|uniref:type IV secretory system conjugative DNA transfer family protein n=1 Tax=Tenacibaculum finnmarkense TaxID=2781243 RepID=UPI001EFA8D0E|nr:type IV secretory system conjugative DNA transfer family protein [Tenacibaculum finnmarkense]MCG8758100.1 type IV secretory system conjugative DNA transfer family protein [Tenacibaculum finnmarkense]MCG8768608.1 type IV secretory system conjugative DNA transfer family protein [Tenacibaculum finnmarkense]MCG8768613.1 type IV secretory system conjugative DNA transfer family protein [Tenacibaculum finnmarkense]
MIGILIALIPFVCIGIYIYKEKTKEAIIKGAVLGLIFLVSLVYFNSIKGTSTKAIMQMLFSLAGALISFVYSVKLVLAGKKASTKLSKEERQEAFEFTAGKKNLTISNPYRGTLIIGGAGSGKSRTFMYPIIDQCAKKGYTGVLYDFKSPELMNLTENCYNYYNSDVKIGKIDFKNPATSQRVNPIAYVESAIHATNYTQALIFNLLPEYIAKQDFWSRSILSVFAGAMWYFKKNKPEYATLPHLFAFFFTANAKEIVDILNQDKEVKGYISSLTEAIEQGAEKQVAGVLGTLKNAIGIYNNPDIFWLLSKDEVNLNANDKDNKTMVLVGNNSTLADTYAPLCSMIITVCSKLMNEPNKEKSVIIIDESPTIYLPNFEQIPATARSNKVAVVVGAQDISQMNDKYGKDKTEVLISNLGNQFYGRTTNQDTAQRVVKMFGQREDVVTLEGQSGSRLGNAVGMLNKRSKSQSIQKRDRIKIQQMTTLNAGQFAGILAEGKNKEFLEQIDLVKMPPFEEMTHKVSNISSSSTAMFDQIYKEINSFLGKSPTVSEKLDDKYNNISKGQSKRFTDADF